MLPLRLKKYKFDNGTRDHRILYIRCNAKKLKWAAFRLYQVISRGLLKKDVYILHVEGESVLTFAKAFKQICRKKGCNGEVLDDIFTIWAENDRIVFNNKVPGKVFKLGKPIPG